VPTIGRRSILVTSASRKAPLLRVTRDALSRIDPAAQMIAGDSDATALARFVADEFWRMPPTIDANLDAILEGCLERDVCAVLPTRDSELRFWALHQGVFAEVGISVIVSSLEAVQRCLDKLAFSQYGSQVGISVVPASESLEAAGKGPFVVKERFGAGSRTIGLNLDFASARTHASLLNAPIFQPYVDGPELSIDGWLDAGGRVVGVILRTRDVVVNGESQVTTTLRSPQLEADARAALDLLDLRGPVVMQAILASDGIRIIEVNPRFGGASTLAISAGLDMLYWSLGEALGESAPQQFNPTNRRLRQVRLPADVVLDDHDF
jgi:carbamoyl-phosphate synthase large subunit